MESTLAWILAFLVASVAVTFVVLFQKRAEERFRLLAADRSRILERERELASRYNALERAHEVALAERAAIELDYVQLAVQKKAQKIAEDLGNDEAEVEVNTVRPTPDSGRRWMQLLGEQDPDDDDAQTADSTPTPVA